MAAPLSALEGFDDLVRRFSQKTADALPQYGLVESRYKHDIKSYADHMRFVNGELPLVPCLKVLHHFRLLGIQHRSKCCVVGQTASKTRDCEGIVHFQRQLGMIWRQKSPAKH